MKKYYPNVLEKLLWAYEQELSVIYSTIPTIVSIYMDELKRCISISTGIYFMEVNGYDITRRFARIINKQFLHLLDQKGVESGILKKCKRITSEYTRGLFIVNRKEAYYGRHM